MYVYLFVCLLTHKTKNMIEFFQVFFFLSDFLSILARNKQSGPDTEMIAAEREPATKVHAVSRLLGRHHQLTRMQKGSGFCSASSTNMA